ncbi:MAG TPA: dephospho-CoA kinase [Lacipirellulaceae bacterium]|jgi:dephospho-CoA kinase|nr:dephospho-CoA kinase [Lacipirellulaceae bacterium]
MKTIGVVGGVASGKSLVSQMLVELGAAVLDADRTGHDVLAYDPDVRDAIRRRWNEAVFTPQGDIDRRAVAKKVFAQDKSAAADRKFLEGLLHPRIGARLETLRDDFAAKDKPAAVLDAPLLLEASWESLCDFIIFVDVPSQNRMARAKKRGWSAAEFADREAAQWPVDKKRHHATHVLPNFGTEAELRTAVRNFWAENIGKIPKG